MEKKRRKTERDQGLEKDSSRHTVLLPNLCFFVGSHTATTSWHFQLSYENNMFVWEKKNGIKCPVHVSTLALFVLTEGLVKRTVYCTLLLNLLAQQTIIQHFLYNVEHVLMMLFTH